MKFKQETGAIISSEGDIVSVIDGTPGMVEFPEMMLYELHKKTPGYVKLLAHTHPPEMTKLSKTDITTLKAQALMMFPYPIRMSTITTKKKRQTSREGISFEGDVFVENRYLAFWEDKETWKRSGRESRQFHLIREFERDCKTGFYMPSYQRVLIEKSYETEEYENY